MESGEKNKRKKQEGEGRQFFHSLSLPSSPSRSVVSCSLRFIFAPSRLLPSAITASSEAFSVTTFR